MADNTQEGFINEMKDAFSFSLKDFAEGFERISSYGREINNVFGQSRERINEMKTSLADTLPKITRLGGDIGDVSATISEIALASRRNVIANTEDITQMYAASKILGISAGDLSENFLDVGISISQIPKELEKSINYVQSIGGNTKEVMKSVQSNMEQMNRYQFEGGVQGLTKMAAQASMLRFDMGETFKLSEKVLDPEGAIETAAAFQRLGVSAGALADPFALMNQSINDPSGLQDSLVNVAKQFTYFDEKTKTFKINPQGVLTLREMEKQTGVSSKEMSKLGLAAAEADKRISAIGSAGLNIKDEDKQYIANIASMGTGGEYEVKINDQETKKLSEITQGEFDKLIKEQKTGPKTLEEIARKQMTYSDVIASDVRAIKQAIIGGVVTQGDLLKVSESLRKASTNTTGSLSNNFSNSKAVRDELTTALGGVKSLMNDIQKGTNPMDAVGDYLKKVGTQGQDISVKLVDSFNKSVKEAQNKNLNEVGMNKMIQEGYDKMLNALDKPDKSGKKIAGGNKDYSYILEGSNTKNLEKVASSGKSYGGSKSSVDVGGDISLNVNITGEGAKDFTISQREELTKTLTSFVNSTEFTQKILKTTNPNSVTKQPI
jgi:hypothetical protein